MNPRLVPPRRARGFTLIETMVTVAIAGVLSSVAYPSLEGQVLRARRTDALVALMQAQLAQERFRANNASLRQPRRSRRARDFARRATTRSQVAAIGADGYALLATAVGAPGARHELPPPAPRARRRIAELRLGQRRVDREQRRRQPSLLEPVMARASTSAASR